MGEDRGMSATPADFTLVQGREGYDIEEVDRFLDRLAVALGEEPPAITAEQVMSQRFKPVRLRAGYDMQEVDAFLDRAAEELRRRHAQAAGVPWELRTASASARPTDRHPASVEHDSSYPAWVRLAAIVALVALLGLAIAQVF
jgi:DivIVA domain-containing protein